MENFEKKIWNKNLRFFPLLPPYLKKPPLGDQRKKSEIFFWKKIFSIFFRFFFHYISFQSQVGLFQKNSKKFLKKILRKSIGYPKVGFSLKKPTLRKAESHCSRTSQVTMSYIFKKFNKFLRKRCEWPWCETMWS